MIYSVKYCSYGFVLFSLQIIALGFKNFLITLFPNNIQPHNLSAKAHPPSSMFLIHFMITNVLLLVLGVLNRIGFVPSSHV